MCSVKANVGGQNGKRFIGIDKIKPFVVLVNVVKGIGDRVWVDGVVVIVLVASDERDKQKEVKQLVHSMF